MRRARTVACAALIGLCGSGAAATADPSPQPLGVSRSVTTLRNPVLMPTPIGASKSVMPAAIDAMSVAWPSPQSLHAVTGPNDCDGHLADGVDLHTVCTNMIVAGNLVLIWTAPATGNLTSNGFRIYAANADGAVGALVTSTADKAHTLAQLPTTASGYAGHCYVATAVYGSRESKPSNLFCAAANSTAKVRFVVPNHSRFAWETHHTGSTVRDAEILQNGSVNLENLPTVGYSYDENTYELGDVSSNFIHRYAVAFNLDPFKGKRLVLAMLQLTIQKSFGNGDNFSCATAIASGNEFWWKPEARAWIDGNFASVARPGATGPTVRADVTSLVNPALAGAPDYGFVLRNDDENLDAFFNKQCETVYGNPQLELVYFDP